MHRLEATYILEISKQEAVSLLDQASLFSG